MSVEIKSGLKKLAEIGTALLVATHPYSVNTNQEEAPLRYIVDCFMDQGYKSPRLILELTQLDRGTIIVEDTISRRPKTFELFRGEVLVLGLREAIRYNFSVINSESGEVFYTGHIGIIDCNLQNRFLAYKPLTSSLQSS